MFEQYLLLADETRMDGTAGYVPSSDELWVYPANKQLGFYEAMRIFSDKNKTAKIQYVISISPYTDPSIQTYEEFTELWLIQKDRDGSVKIGLRKPKA